MAAGLQWRCLLIVAMATLPFFYKAVGNPLVLYKRELGLRETEIPSDALGQDLDIKP